MPHELDFCLDSSFYSPSDFILFISFFPTAITFLSQERIPFLTLQPMVEALDLLCWSFPKCWILFLFPRPAPWGSKVGLTRKKYSEPMTTFYLLSYHPMPWFSVPYNQITPPDSTQVWLPSLFPMLYPNMNLICFESESTWHSCVNLNKLFNKYWGLTSKIGWIVLISIPPPQRALFNCGVKSEVSLWLGILFGGMLILSDHHKVIRTERNNPVITWNVFL